MAGFGVKIFKQEVKFVAGVAQVNQFPKLFLPQVAFVGKSNVGKSSLINKLCNRKSLARVSHTPGRTRQINFFSIGDKFLLSDLPGYGFAKVSANQRLQWEKLIRAYFTLGENRIAANLLVDARRGIKDHDVHVMNLLSQNAIKFQLVFTKADKIGGIDKFIEDMNNYLNCLGFTCNIIITSSRSGLGIRELQANMLALL